MGRDHDGHAVRPVIEVEVKISVEPTNLDDKIRARGADIFRCAPEQVQYEIQGPGTPWEGGPMINNRVFTFDVVIWTSSNVPAPPPNNRKGK